jgi:beta-N-acetylhexosaminidase
MSSRIAFTNSRGPDILASLVRSRASIFLVCLLLLSIAVGGGTLSFWDDLPDDVLVEQLLDAMTADELLGQTLMLGWSGQDPSPAIEEWITTTNLGGVKVFGWNGTDLVRLSQAIEEMQSLAADSRFGIPLLVATDQEGGWVRHVKGSDSLSTSVTPGNMAIGASALPYDAYQSAFFIASELRALGINMNFAPTVDVYVNPEATVIGPRAFSSDPVQTATLAVAYFSGQEDAGVISTAKHFPGHGSASGDSHGTLPVIGDSLDELIGRDFVPYRFLVAEGLPAVLSAHLSYPAITGDNRPASLSPCLINEVLADMLGFQGVVVTDDLYMAGAQQYGNEQGWDMGRLVLEAIAVGNDMVMLSQTPEVGGLIWDRLVNETREDEELRLRVREAARAVLTLKLRYLKAEDRVPLDPDQGQIARLMQSNDAAEFFRDQAGRSITRLSDDGIPLRLDDGESMIIAGKDRDFLRIAGEFFPSAAQFRIESQFAESSDARDRAGFLSAARGHDTVLFCVSDRSSLEVLQQIEGSDLRVVVVSILSPIYLFELGWVDTAVAAYGWGDESYRAALSVLVGAYQPYGSLPVSLDELVRARP